MNHTESAPNFPTISGKAIILTVGLMAVVGASFALWYRWEQADEAVAFWGPTAAELLAEDRAQAEMLWLEPRAEGDPQLAAPLAADQESPEILPLDGDFYRVQARAVDKEIQGLIHLRYALTQDASFDFAQPPKDDTAPWPYALRLTHGDDTVLVLFDPAQHRVGLPGGKSATLQGPMAENLGGYLEEVFAEPKP